MDEKSLLFSNTEEKQNCFSENNDIQNEKVHRKNEDESKDRGIEKKECNKKLKKTKKGKLNLKGNFLKGKGRRCIFKKNVLKSPVSVASPVVTDHLYYQGIYYQVGDIVSVIDIAGGTYYAQIRGLLQDQFCEKSAVITWLIPTERSPPPHEKFDPSTYVIGPEEEIPRKLEFLRFVSHAPSDYFKNKNSPYATISNFPRSKCIWSKMSSVYM